MEIVDPPGTTDIGLGARMLGGRPVGTRRPEPVQQEVSERPPQRDQNSDAGKPRDPPPPPRKRHRKSYAIDTDSVVNAVGVRIEKSS